MAYYNSSWKFCGLAFFDHVAYQTKYIRHATLEAHASIISSVCRTTLKQTFVSPDSTGPLKEVRYQFPLFDGVSVVGFTCTIGDRIIHGVVKEKAKAREDFNAAVSRGETAGLLEQLPAASDVFTTTIGNVPPNSKIEVQITYLGELKHDAQVDGIRLTIPTSIAPRYGDHPTEMIRSQQLSTDSGLKITVDAEVPAGSQITSIQSPSHQISVNIGRTSTGSPQEQLVFHRASATLALADAELDKDFVLQVVATNTGNPLAVLEQHPTIPNQRALMATLVPKFSLPADKPEIVFICDRSGSMHQQVHNLKSALRIFVKSMSVGTKFNICSFGSTHKFLWKRSQSYDQKSVEEAMAHIENFAADFGGTEMYAPVEDTFKRRYKDMNLEVFLLTDGEIWDQERLMKMIGKEVSDSKGSIRVFSLGIGSGASTSLIEGVARAGNGFSQAIGDNEDMSSKVVRMLKGAMFPHIKDYSLEIKYVKDADAMTEGDDDDFEIVEKVLDGLVIDVDKPAPPYSEKDSSPSTKQKVISLFDSSIDNTKEETKRPEQGTAKDRYSHVPPVTPPKLLQTPDEIPPLFPFNRTTVYLLLSPETNRNTPKSVILRGTSQHGPLELEIPVTVLDQPGETIHQLAARKAVLELEEGRGWIYSAKNSEGKLIREKHDGLFSDMVEREAVRLGVQYQVGGKWCSFVALESNPADGCSGDEAQEEETELEQLEQAGPSSGGGSASFFGGGRSRRSRKMAYKVGSSMQPDLMRAPPPPGGATHALFGAAPASPAAPTASASYIPPYHNQLMMLEQQNKSRRFFAAQPFEAVGTTVSGLMSNAASHLNAPPLQPQGPMPASAASFSADAPLGASRQSDNSVLQDFDFDSFLHEPAGSFEATTEGGRDEFAMLDQYVPMAPQAKQPHGGRSAAAAAAAPAGRSKSGMANWMSSSSSSSSKRSSSGSPPVTESSESLTDSTKMKKKSARRISPVSAARRGGAMLSSSSPPVPRASNMASSDPAHGAAAAALIPADKLQALIVLHGFAGNWQWAKILELFGWDEAKVLAAWGAADVPADKDVVATALAVAYLRKEKADQKDTWELLVEKALSWMDDASGGQMGKGEELATKGVAVLAKL